MQAMAAASACVACRIVVILAPPPTGVYGPTHATPSRHRRRSKRVTARCATIVLRALPAPWTRFTTCCGAAGACRHTTYRYLREHDGVLTIVSRVYLTAPRLAGMSK